MFRNFIYLGLLLVVTIFPSNASAFLTNEEAGEILLDEQVQKEFSLLDNAYRTIMTVGTDLDEAFYKINDDLVFKLIEGKILMSDYKSVAEYEVSTLELKLQRYELLKNTLSKSSSSNSFKVTNYYQSYLGFLDKYEYAVAQQLQTLKEIIKYTYEMDLEERDRLGILYLIGTADFIDLNADHQLKGLEMQTKTSLPGKVIPLSHGVIKAGADFTRLSAVLSSGDYEKEDIFALSSEVKQNFQNFEIRLQEFNLGILELHKSLARFKKSFTGEKAELFTSELENFLNIGKKLAFSINQQKKGILVLSNYTEKQVKLNNNFDFKGKTYMTLYNAYAGTHMQTEKLGLDLNQSMARVLKIIQNVK